MGQGPVPEKIRTAVDHAIRATWPPEFLNRIDSIIIYRALSHANIRKIVDIRLQEVQQRLDAKKMKLSLTEEAKNYLSSVGYSPTYGARPLQRSIMNELLNPLSIYILDDRVRDGETIRVELDRKHNRLVIIPNHEGSGAADNMELDYDEDTPIIEEMD
jgi:ATP-dependent Clp protease ATP-binding subunit ClpB